MAEIKSVVLTAEDLEASPFLLGMGALAGDTVSITRPDAPAENAAGQDTAPAEHAAPAEQNTTAVDPSAGGATGVGRPPQEGDVCEIDGKPGTLQARGSKASGITLVCVPTGDSAEA